MSLKIHEPSSQAVSLLHSFLDERIYEFNVSATGIRDGKAFACVLKDESAQVFAAVDGHTWGKCCHVVHLWVHESRRRSGIGSALLRETEAEAMRRGCAQVLLFTHSFQAPRFYEGLGYVRQAAIPNYPDGHAQFVYLKQIGLDQVK